MPNRKISTLSSQRLKQIGFLTIISVILIISNQSVSAQDFAPGEAIYYVANNGNDFNPGTFAAPFLTVQKCAEVAIAGQTCTIRGGTYRETIKPTNSGLPNAPIRFEPYQNETVVISGADRIVRGWKKYGRGNIYWTIVTLPVLKYSDTGFFANQVFVNGEMQTEARFPNTGTSLMQPVLKGGTVVHDSADDTRAFVRNDTVPNLPEGWNGALVWANEWYTSRTGIIDGGTFDNLTAQMTASYSRDAYWFFLAGKLGLLDSEREWFYNGAFKRLYFWSPVNGAPQNVEVKKRNFAFDLTDNSYIEIKNIDIFAATITTGNNSRNVVLDGLRAKYVSHFMTLPPLPESEHAPNSDNALILASHNHDTGIQLRGENNTLKNSEISFSAGNLVLLKGRGHTVDNNVLTDANYMSSYAAPVLINGQNHQILHNTISGAGRSAIGVTFQMNGTNSIQTEIGYNKITGFGALSSDLGAIYICCSVDLTGTRIHHNTISSPYGYSYWWDAAGIYTDNDSYNSTVDHNVVYDINTHFPKAAKIASKYTTARERIYNNVFAAPVNLGTDARYLIYNNILTTTEAFTGASIGNNLFSDSNPLFTDPASGNFSLQSGSPAINAGRVIAPFTDGYNGSAPDAGAFEFGQTQWRAGATLPPR